MNNNTYGKFTINIFLFLFLLFGSMYAHSLELSIAVHGEVKVLELTENTHLKHPLSPSRHYSGHVQGSEKEWVRISKLADGTWSGLVFTGGEMHFVENQQPEDDYAIEFQAFSAVAEHPTCGLDHNHSLSVGELLLSASNLSKPAAQSVIESTTPASAPAEPVSQSALLVPQSIAASFAAACAGNIVDGTCVFADLQLVFDQEYQEAFAGDVQGSTDSLINMVEGYYLNQFDIAFNDINRVFLTDATDIYTDSNVAVTVLNSVFSRRCEQQPAGAFCRLLPNFDSSGEGPSDFLQADDSIVHLVTGRDFAGTTAGIAFLDTICGPNNVGTSNLSRTFSGGVSLPFTAAIIAHEIGHNFGANHDGEASPGATPANATSCPSTGFVMAASLGSLPTMFSSCSEETITQAMATNINTNPNLSRCATAPVDLSITSGAFLGAANVSDSVNLEDAFIVNPTEVGFLNAGNAEVVVSSTGATIQAASIAGSACTILSSTQQAICPLSVATASSDIDMTVSVFDNTVSISARDNANALFRDTDRANSNASFSFVANGVAVSPPTPTPTAPPAPAPTPTTPSSPPAATPESSGGGGGGGGSTGLGLLFGLLILLFTRRRYA